MKVGVHEFVFNSLPYITVLDALSQFSTGFPRDLLCSDDLVLTVTGKEEVMKKITRLKDGLASQDLWENVGKTYTKWRRRRICGAKLKRTLCSLYDRCWATVGSWADEHSWSVQVWKMDVLHNDGDGMKKNKRYSVMHMYIKCTGDTPVEWRWMWEILITSGRMGALVRIWKK